MTIALIDYGAGNLHSLAKALDVPGATVHIETDAARATDTDLLVLPGVGAFAAAAEELEDPVRFTSLVPTQLQRILEPASGVRNGDAVSALKSFSAVLLGGSAAPPRLLAAARAADVRVVVTYGMSETCGGCVYDGVPLVPALIGLFAISEALVATGVGLLVAIPAVIAFNIFRSRMKKSTAQTDLLGRTLLSYLRGGRDGGL